MMVLKVKISSTIDDITRTTSNDTTQTTDSVDSNITSNFSEGKNFIPIPQLVVSVLNIFLFDDQQIICLT